MIDYDDDITELLKKQDNACAVCGKLLIDGQIHIVMSGIQRNPFLICEYCHQEQHVKYEENVERQARGLAWANSLLKQLEQITRDEKS